MNSLGLLLMLPPRSVFAIKIHFNSVRQKVTLSTFLLSLAPAFCRKAIFNLAPEQIPIIEDGNPAIYLGKPVRAFIPKDLDTIQFLKQCTIKIFTYKLTL